jgi:hypothetical protein
MISIKNIDLLNIKIKNNIVFYKEDLLIIKSPIVNAINNSEKDLNSIKIELDSSIKSSRLKEILLYIKRKYTELDLNLNFIDENILDIKIESDSLFFDSNHNKISKNSLNRESRILCSFYIKNSDVYLHQCMKL